MKNKHLTLDERIVIEQQLSIKSSFKKIASLIDKDCSTISKEIRNNFQTRTVGAYGRHFNNCINRNSCTHKFICNDCNQPAGRLCRNCKNCSSVCSDFSEDICPKFSIPPYICNGCENIKYCTTTKHFYKASIAQKNYTSTLKEARSGFVIDQAEIDYLNSLLVPLIKKQKQSIHNVFINNSASIMHSEKTIYNLIDSGVLQVRNIDLPRKVRFKAKRNTSKTYKVDKKCLIGRTYEDYLNFISEHKDISTVQMDSVVGIQGGKVLLTIHFVTFGFMIAFIRDRNDAKSVSDIFEYIYTIVGKNLFEKLFQVILTDNGSEFSDPLSIEFDKDSNRRTHIFYCHPYSPNEKGSCEVNHEFFRKFYPKGQSFNTLTQKDINLIMSHINSYSREKLNNKTPTMLFSSIYGYETTKLLGITEIPPNNVTLSKSILN